ncbi:MAG: hypothetical protein K8S18_16485 [Desulfobacula sp.]|nr:hypothetical protein [Desulfobacula sp.]
MIQKLSSIKFAFYNLIFLIALMGTGVYLSRLYKQGFVMMNESHILEWIISAWADTPILLIWFILLCCSAALLFINALLCSLTKQIYVAIKSGMLEKWLFFVLHCLFVVVLACHGLILVAGSKDSNIMLFPNESIEFKNQYKIEVSNVVFTDDINILKADKNNQRALMTRKNIHRKQNFALVSLYRQSNLLKTKKVMMLSPLRYQSVQVTVTQFIVKEKEDQERIGVQLTITENRLNIFFFTIYGLMILILGLYVLFIFTRERGR